MDQNIYTENESLYDAIYGQSADEVLGFLEWLFQHLELKPDKDSEILDMGAGTGRILIPLSQQDFSIIGIEPFDAMIKHAKTKAETAGTQINIEKGSFQTLDQILRFRFIMGINSTMSYLREISEWEDAFSRIYKALVPGGYFLLDLMDYFNLIKNYRQFGLREFDHEGLKGNYFINHEVDIENSLWIHDMLIFLEESNGKIRKIQDLHKLTMVSKREILIYARNAGLQLKHQFQSFEDRLEERKGGFRMIFLFQKPKN